MITPQPGYGPRQFGLDGVRAAAAAMVVIAHGLMYAGATLPAVVTPAAVLATVGVEVFFVLSGFLIAPGLFAVCDGRMRARRFWLRRAWRTLPVFYIFLAVNCLIAMWVARDRVPTIPFAFFSQSLLSPPATPFFPESWSLAVEEWFYLTATLVTAACLRFDRHGHRLFYWWLLALVALSPLIRAIWTVAQGYGWDAGLRKLTLLRMDAIAIGVLVAAHARRTISHRTRATYAACGAAAIVVACGQLALLVHSGDYLRPPTTLLGAVTGSLTLSLLGVGAALLLPAAATASPPKKAAAIISRAVSHVALWSYAIYLTHFPLLLLFDRYVPSMHSQNPATLLASLLAWAIATVLAAAAFYILIERRILAYRDRVISK